MPIGHRNPLNQDNQVSMGTGSPTGFGIDPQNPTSSYGGSCSSGHQWFRRILSGVMQDVSALVGAPFSVPVAQLPAPNPGQHYVIERMSIATNGATDISIIVGDLAASNGVDNASGITTSTIVMADGDSAIRIRQGEPLSIVWFAPAAAGGCTANVQVRVEND